MQSPGLRSWAGTGLKVTSLELCQLFPAPATATSNSVPFISASDETGLSYKCEKLREAGALLQSD